MDKLWLDEAWEGFETCLEQDRKNLKKILRLLRDIDRYGYTGIGKPEPLKGNLNGYWSRRIDSENRLVYQINEGRILIIQCGSHYGDK